jgi:hypothetical protein
MPSLPKYDSQPILFGDTGQTVLSGISKFRWQIQRKKCVFPFPGQGVLIKNPTVWIDGARPPPKNVCKFIKIKIAELYTNHVQFWHQSYPAMEIS